MKNNILYKFIFILLFFLTVSFACSKESYSAVERIRNVTGKDCSIVDDFECVYGDICSKDINSKEIEPCYTSNYNVDSQSCDVGNIDFNPFGQDLHWDLGNSHCISYVTTTAIGLAAAFMGCDTICPTPAPPAQNFAELAKTVKPKGDAGKIGGSGSVVKNGAQKNFDIDAIPAGELSKTIWGRIKLAWKNFKEYISPISSKAKVAANLSLSAGTTASNMVAGFGVIDPMNIVKIGIYTGRCANILAAYESSQCCAASIACSVAYGTAIGILGIIFEIAKKNFGQTTICGEGSKVWKKIQHDDYSYTRWTLTDHDYFKCLKFMLNGVPPVGMSSTGTGITTIEIYKPTNCDLNKANQRLCNLLDKFNLTKCTYDIRNKQTLEESNHYKEFKFKGLEYQDNGDGACDIPIGSEWAKLINESSGKQRYYFRGPNQQPNFACQQYLKRGLEDKQGKKAFECCKERAKNTTCIENKTKSDFYKFCSENGKECWFNADKDVPLIRYQIYRAETDTGYLCAKTYSLCPFDYPVGGGTDELYVDEKTAVTSNFCQYRRHCIKIPPVAEFKLPNFGNSFFSDACFTRVGGTQFFTSLSNINSPIPLSSRNFSAPIVQCLKESLENNFMQVYGRNYCRDASDNIINGKCINPITNATSDFIHIKGEIISDNLLTVIQRNFAFIIRIAMVFAIVMFGYNILLASPEMFAEKKVILMFVIKIGLVSFFTLDENWHKMFVNSLLKISSDLSEITFIPNKIDDGCTFPKHYYNLLQDLRDNAINLETFYKKTKELELKNIEKSYSYETRYLRIWDTLDCKLARAIGYGPDINSDNFSKMIFAGFITGPLGITMAFAGLAYGFMLISIILRSIHIAVMSIVGVILLLFVSPITITCVLFERTKGIFENWYKQMFGFILQPMILFAYLGLLLTIFDNIFLGDARFVKLTPANTTITEKLPDLDCSDYGPNNSIKPNNTSIYCIFNFQTYKKYTGLEIFGLAFPVLQNLNREKINTIIRAAIILFIFYQFLDKITFVAKKLVGGAELKADDMPDIKGKMMKFTKGVQTRALNSTKKFAQTRSKPLVKGATETIGGIFSKSKKTPTNPSSSNSSDSVSFTGSSGGDSGGSSGGSSGGDSGGSSGGGSSGGSSNL